VSVNAVTEQASCPIGWRLFLPESWDDDTPATQQRRAACHLPESVHHRPKWQLVLDLLEELAGWKLSPPVLLADSGYGEVGVFRGGLDARQIPYVVEARADTSAYPEQVRPTITPHKSRGRRPRPRYRDKPCSLHQLALQAGQQACLELLWRRGSKGLQRGRFLALRVRPASSPRSGSASQIWWRRPDDLATAGPPAGPARLLGRRLSPLPPSHAALAPANRTGTGPDLTPAR
jgi:SRSO17 transposase